MIQAIHNSIERNSLSIYCVLPVDSQKISFILSCEIIDLLTKRSGRRDKVILFAGNSEISKFPDHNSELFINSNGEIPTGNIIASYIKSRTSVSPKLLFSIRRSKPSWFTAKHIFASVVSCSGLSDMDLAEIISWNRENSIPKIILLDDSLLRQRLEGLSKQDFHILGVDKTEIEPPNDTRSFFSSALKTHETVKILNTKRVDIPGQIQHAFNNARSILKQITDDTHSDEAGHIVYMLRILLKKLESSPCKVNLSDRYFTGQFYDIPVETSLENVERLVESYGGPGKSSMYRCILNIKQIISGFSQTNPPKFSELLNEINTAIGKREPLVILFSNKAQIKGFYESIKQTSQLLDEDKLLNDKIILIHPFAANQGVNCDRVVIVSDYPHNPILKAFIGIESTSSVLLHYPGESTIMAMELKSSYEFSKTYFSHKVREKVIERIKKSLPPDNISISQKQAYEEETSSIDGKIPFMPEIKVTYDAGAYGQKEVQSNQGSTEYAQNRAIKITFSDGEETYVTEHSTIRVLLTSGTVETKRATDIRVGDQIISFRDSIVSDIYSAIRDELKDWDPKTLQNFLLVEMWKRQLKKVMKDNEITAVQMVEALSKSGSKIEEAETIRNWTLDLDRGGVIGPQDMENLDRLASLFPEYFGKIPMEELHRAISWVRGLPNRLISLSQKVILAKEFGEQNETDEDLLLYDIGKGIELKIVSTTSFSED